MSTRPGTPRVAIHFTGEQVSIADVLGFALPPAAILASDEAKIRAFAA